MIASRLSCSPLSINENCNFSTSCSIAATDCATSACISSSGSSSNNWANPSRSFSCAAMPSHVETSSRSAFNCCIWACALRLSDQKSGAMLSSSSLLICVVLFARSKTHHGFLDAFLQAFDLVYKFIHSTIVSRFVCVRTSYHRVCELSEKNALCMFYLAPTRGATTFWGKARSRNVVAPLVGARKIQRPCILPQYHSRQ